MRSWLRSHGAKPTTLLFDPLPSRYAVFHRYESVPLWEPTVHKPDLASVDGIILLDTCAYNQIDPLADWLRSSNLPKLAVDHHITRDGLADDYVVDESAAATCLILYDWARALDWPIHADTRDPLFIGIAMDTGWFRHSNTDDRVLAAAADLVAHGADTYELYRELYLRETPARVRLLGAALSTLELLSDDRIAVMTLSSRTMAECGAVQSDTEDIVNEPLRIGPVVVSVLLVESGDGLIRTSFRSKPQFAPRHGGPSPPHEDEQDTAGQARPTFGDIDVSIVAQAFGGGGHKRAAAARITGKLPDVRRAVLRHLEARLR
jgi:phosphoesterase RecJ-like protein